MLLLRSLLLEHALWLIPASIFLSYTIANIGLPVAMVFPHFKLVFRFALAFTALRFFLTGKLNLLLILMHGSAVVLLITFYAVSLIGFIYWGSAPTTQMIAPYLEHSEEFLKTLGISHTLVICVTALFLVAIFSMVFYAHTRSNYLAKFSQGLSIPTRALLSLTGVYMAFSACLDISLSRYHAQMEPLTMVFSGQPTIENQAWSPRIHADQLALVARNSYQPSNLTPTRNVILIVGDALRPSRMSLFGANRNTTPELEKLTKSLKNTHIGTVTTSCAESFCGLISLSRSRYAHDVSKNDLAITDVLASHGYQTSFVLGGDHTNFYGLRDWFGNVDSYWDGLQAKTYTNDDRAVIKQLNSIPVAGSTPRFLQIHLMSTHALGMRADFSKRWTPAYNYYTSPGFRKGLKERTKAVRNYYDNGVAQFDGNIRSILNILKDKEYLKDALVIITGDHGEMLGEHNLYSHANGVYQPVLEVPLLLFRFGHEGSVYNNNSKAAQVDIGPTILAELNLPVPERWIGKALNELETRRFIHFEHQHEFGLIDFSIPDQKWKYWLNRKNGAEFAYELYSDPGETRNRITAIKPNLRAIWRNELAPSVASLPLR